MKTQHPGTTSPNLPKFGRFLLTLTAYSPHRRVNRGLWAFAFQPSPAYTHKRCPRSVSETRANDRTPSRAALDAILRCADPDVGRHCLRRNRARDDARAGRSAARHRGRQRQGPLLPHNAAHPWYPASVTKLMTAYVTLRAVKEGRLTLETPLTVSSNAAAQAPVKMGFGAGTQVTVDNALKMLMVKSANDIAVVLAEGVAGSVENFADQMNAQRPPPRHDAIELRQSERLARRRPDLLRARSRHARARHHPRDAGIRLLLEPARHPHGQDGAAQLQYADRPLSRRRRHEDRLHLRLGLQSGSPPPRATASG